MTTEAATAAAATVIAIATVVYTIGAFFFWRSNRRLLDDLGQQVRRQTILAQAASDHAGFDAHRELFLELIREQDFLTVLSKGFGLTPEETKAKFIATLLINHACRVFVDADCPDISDREKDGFKVA